MFAQTKTALYYNEAGWLLLQSGESYKALTQFKNALTQNPAYLEAKNGLAQCYLRNSAFQNALKLFGEVVQKDPQNEKALIGLGDAYTGLGDYDKAIDQYEKVLELYKENISAHYGLARIFYRLNRNLWAERKIETILKLNPYHYETLLLYAEIKNATGNKEEAAELINKAITSREDFPDAYIASGKLLINNYVHELNDDLLLKSTEMLNRAVAISPDSYDVYINLALISAIQKDYNGAIAYYKKAIDLNGDDPVLNYNYAVVYKLADDQKNSQTLYRKAYNLQKENDIIQNGYENFLIYNDFPIGNPDRSDFSDYHFHKYSVLQNKSFSDYALYHLRRSILLNPMKKESHEKLLEYYSAKNFNYYYIEELKTLQRLYPSAESENLLNIAVIKRRNTLYGIENFNEDSYERSVPKILIMDFQNNENISAHYFAGKILADNINFAIGQYGRLEPVEWSVRNKIINDVLKNSVIPDYEFIDKLFDYQKENVNVIDYVVFGDFSDYDNRVDISVKIMDYKTGIIISQKDFFSNEKDYLSRVSFLAATHIYNSIPFTGKIIKQKDDAIVVNLGLYDGLNTGDLLFAEINEKLSIYDKYSVKKKVLFKIDNIDTLICRAVPLISKDIDKVSEGVMIFPQNKIRAKKIE